jgi:protein-L-isoaspartate(D-aspartate) O-methyltransferase
MNTTNPTFQRANMVEGQLRPNKVNQKPILARFSDVKREAFVANPETAYLDQPARLSEDREIFSPLVAARLIQSLNVSADDTVLVIAAGTGYTATILAPLCKQVILVEDNISLSELASKNLRSEGVHNADVIQQDPTHGFQSAAPYNAILIDAPFAELHGPWVAQLAEGGRMAGVRIGSDGIPEATLYTKHANSLIAEVLFETKGKVHPAFIATEKFVF